MAIEAPGTKKIFRDPNIKTLRKGNLLRGLPKPFKYKKTRTRRIDPDYDSPVTEAAEILTGFIVGEQASALEERFAIALREKGIQFQFQFIVYSVFQLPGEERTIDFIVFDGGIPFPVETGSFFVHGHTSQQEVDKARDQMINEILKPRGFQPIIRLELDHPESIQDARDIVAKLFT